MPSSVLAEFEVVRSVYTIVLHLMTEREWKRCSQPTTLRGNAMNRSLATLLTTLLLTAALMPKALAHGQQLGSPMSLASSSANIPDQAAVDPTQPTATKTDALPEAPTNAMPNSNAIRAERSRLTVDQPSVDGAYPGYCPALPIGTQPGDWDYREALEKCLYGS
ncbi:MAG: hypothetical protein ACAF41_00635 (plasmid) [Leptolyngbya sp. BL-A-14]